MNFGRALATGLHHFCATAAVTAQVGMQMRGHREALFKPENCSPMLLDYVR